MMVMSSVNIKIPTSVPAEYHPNQHTSSNVVNFFSSCQEVLDFLQVFHLFVTTILLLISSGHAMAC